MEQNLRRVHTNSRLWSCLIDLRMLIWWYNLHWKIHDGVRYTKLPSVWRVLAEVTRDLHRFAAITEVVWFVVRKATWHHLLLVGIHISSSFNTKLLVGKSPFSFIFNPKHVSSSSPFVCQTLPLPTFSCSVVSIVFFVWKKWCTNSMNLGCPGTFCRAKDLDILQ